MTGKQLEAYRKIVRAKASQFCRFNDGYNIIDNPSHTVVDRQRATWEAAQAKREAAMVADLTVVQVESKSRPGVIFQSLAFFQRRQFS